MKAIQHYLVIAARPADVFMALTTQNGLAAWWTEEVIAQPIEGSIAEFKFGDRYHNKMSIDRLVSGSLVEWTCLAGDEEWIDTRLTFRLESRDQGTILRFKHGNWRAETDFFASCNYHWGNYMTSLKNYCENGQGSPFRRG